MRVLRGVLLCIALVGVSVPAYAASVFDFSVTIPVKIRDAATSSKPVPAYASAFDFSAAIPKKLRVALAPSQVVAPTIVAVTSPTIYTGTLHVPSGGVLTTASGVSPSFGGVPSWTGACPISQGCTGTTTPGATVNSPITVTGTWPNQIFGCATCVTSVGASGVLSSSGGTTPSISLTGIVPTANGGTGTATPGATVTGPITVSGTWPNQVFGCATCVTSVAASGVLSSTGGTTPSISLSGIVPIANGGTGTASPGLVAGSNISLSGSWPNQTVAVSASPSFTLVTANTLKSQPAANVNAILQLTSSGTGLAEATLDTANGTSFVSLNDDATGIGSLVNVGEIYWKTPSGNCGGTTIASIEGTTAGTAAHPGAAIVFYTAMDDGTCTLNEPLVLTPNQHVYFPGDSYYHQFNTPASCAANVPCGTITWTFNHPFINTSGGQSQPYCPSGLIRDDNNANVTWTLSVAQPTGSLSATSVTYNYTPSTSISSATTLEVWSECHTSGF